MKVQGHGHAAPGTVLVEDRIPPERKIGSIILSRPDNRKSIVLQYGKVVDCGAYVDRHGTVYGPGSGLSLWPLQPGTLVEYKTRNWDTAVDPELLTVVNSEDVTRVWEPSEWKD